MTELQEKLKQVLADLEKKLKNKEDFEYAKEQIFGLYTLFLDELDEIQQTTSAKLDNISAKYSMLEDKMGQVEQELNRIQRGLNADSEYEMEIVCPYCDADFTLDTSDEGQEAVACPECNNIIELDWSDDHDEYGPDFYHHHASEEFEDDDM